MLAALDGPCGRARRMVVDVARRDRVVSRIESMASAQRLAVSRESRDWFDRRFGGIAHQGVALELTLGAPLEESALYHRPAADASPVLLVLDGVQDPHNLGACLRTADATGVTAVVVPRDGAAGLTPVVSKVAAGAAETVPLVTVVNLVRTLERLKAAGYWVFGADGDARDSVHGLPFDGPTVVVLGAEGRGLRRLTRQHCDRLFRIPMLGTVTSLNVSVATGVVLYERVRQRDTRADRSRPGGTA